MALTQTQEQALLDMLQKWTGAQERRPVKPSSLTQSISTPSTGWQVVGYTATGDKSLMRLSLTSVGYSLSTNSLNIPVGGAINWNDANHLVSSKQLKTLYENDVKAPLDRHTAAISAAQARADAAHTSLQQTNSSVNANTGSINELRKKMVSGWKEGLVMDFGALPSSIGASTVTFNKRFRGTPLVIVNFWGDIGNPRFTLAMTGSETWGIRLSATYPGVWAVFGEPV